MQNGMSCRRGRTVRRVRRHAELAVEAIGHKARQLLESLPEGMQSLGLESLSPGHWWAV